MGSDDELFQGFLRGEDSPEIRAAFAPIDVGDIGNLPSVEFDLHDQDAVVQTMLSAPLATEPMSEEGKAELERYHSRSVIRRRAAEGDHVAAAMLDELAKSKK